MRNLSLPVVIVAAAALLCGVTARAEELPAGYGTLTPSGSTFTTQVTNPVFEARNPTPGFDDADGYIFRGFPGMVLTATLKPTKGSQLIPVLEVVRPGGAVVSDDEGLVLTAKGNTRTAVCTLDAGGWWQVRVRGGELTHRNGDPGVGEVLSDQYVVFSSGKYTLSIKYTNPALPTLPTVTKNFSTTAQIDSKSDVDDHEFQGYVGQSLKATVSVSLSSRLLPGVQLVRPDGTQVDPAPVGLPPVITTTVSAKKGITVNVNYALDAQGTWKIHVFGLEPTPDPNPQANNATTGAYSLSVKLGKPPTVPSLAPDANGQYRFTIAADAGATLSYTLSFTGNAPTFNSMLDPAGKAVPGFPVATSVKSYVFSTTAVLGNYTLTFDAPQTPPSNVTFSAKLSLPKGLKAKKATLSEFEPTILPQNSLNRVAGAAGATLVVYTNEKIVDPNNPDPAKVKLYVDHTPLLLVAPQTTSQGTAWRGNVPQNVPLGLHDVVVESSTGQVFAKSSVFTMVLPPVADSISPTEGSEAGGTIATITGSRFRPGHMGITIDGAKVGVLPIETTETTITFEVPPRAPGVVVFGVIDNDSDGRDDVLVPTYYFTYVSTPVVSRIVPSLTSVLGGETIFVQGSAFDALDHVYLETAPNSNQYTEVTKIASFETTKRHAFYAPIKGKGIHRIYVQDRFNNPVLPIKWNLTYFTFANLSGALPVASDKWGGSSTAVSDFDGVLGDDLFISNVGSGSVAATPQTRVLKNDGAGHFTDVTLSVMPSVTSDDDWRADRIWVTDCTQDGYPDIEIATNDQNVPGSSKSHLRILVNEPRTGFDPTDRVFRDRTVDLMPAPRSSSPLYGGGGGISDNWRALDMWIGDLDKGPAGPPEILITHKEAKEELDVGCGNYCASPFASGYTYGFYWGGSREFVWNVQARGGLGQYKFEANFFPRRAGVRVPVFNPPPGVIIPVCNPTSGYGGQGVLCRGTFTPFTGKRIAAGNIDLDTKPDVAVVSDVTVTKDNLVISSLQVGINKVPTNLAASNLALITDVTPVLTALGGDFKMDAVEITATGYPDGNSFGDIVCAKASPPAGGAYAMRMLKFKVPSIPGDAADFDEITGLCLPFPGVDQLQASKILFRDVDNDGDQDMIIVAKAAPGGSQAALRILRNNVVASEGGIMVNDLQPLMQALTVPPEFLDGDFLSIGDLNVDGALDFVITRTTPVGAGNQTRIVKIDK